MCFSISASLEAQLKRAMKNKSQSDVLKIREKIKSHSNKPFFHLSGFAHPQVLVYTNENIYEPELAYWGLIPEWIKDRKSVSSIWNKTLNARLETIFEKPSFKTSAESKRCIVYVDGFFEFHHYKGKSYPFYVHSKNKEPLILAGLWSEWFDRSKNQIITSFTIVTRKAASLLTKIHNNPKLKEARIPVVLNEAESALWLDINNVNEKDIATQIINTNESFLKAHPVQKLSGKAYLGNTPEVVNEHQYEGLVFDF